MRIDELDVYPGVQLDEGLLDSLKKGLSIAGLAAVLGLAAVGGAEAHPGPVDGAGGHFDYNGTYHFERGPLAGIAFHSRQAAINALQQHLWRNPVPRQMVVPPAMVRQPSAHVQGPSMPPGNYVPGSIYITDDKKMFVMYMGDGKFRLVGPVIN